MNNAVFPGPGDDIFDAFLSSTLTSPQLLATNFNDSQVYLMRYMASLDGKTNLWENISVLVFENQQQWYFPSPQSSRNTNVSLSDVLFG